MTLPAPPAARPTSRLAIAALVLSFVFSPAGLVLGIVALRHVDGSEGRLEGRGLAIAAIAISGLMLVVGVLCAAIVFKLLSTW